MSEHDAVQNPVHYDLFPGQQVIDIIRASLTPEEFAGYLKGNVLKYRLRAGEKGEPIEDLGKAAKYRSWLYEEGKKVCPLLAINQIILDTLEKESRPGGLLNQ